MNIGVGSDAEFFVQNEKKEIVSSIGMLGGSKEEPRFTDHGAVQEDNVLAEMNTIPAYSARDFVNNFNSARKDMDDILKEKGLSSIILASHRMDRKYLQHPQAKRAGCEPDFNGWTLSINDRPELEQTNLRTASAHIHISWPDFEEDFIRQFSTAAVMDVFHGVVGVLLDSDVERRKLYGKAGSCRLKPYGVEYRTSSNWWTSNDGYIEWTFNQAVKAVENWDNGQILNSSDEIQRVINSYDARGARALIQRFNVETP